MNAATIGVDDLDLTTVVRPGDTVLWSPGVAEPLPLVGRLLEQRHSIGGFAVLSGGAGYTEVLRPEHSDVVSIWTLGAVGSHRALCRAGMADIVPSHLSDLPRLIDAGVLRVDVVLVQVALDDEGRPSFGAAAGYVDAAIRSARVVVAEVNARAPWTAARYPVDGERIDVLVPTDRPLVEVAAREPSAVEFAVAERVVDLVDDGSTVQIGIGGVPDAVVRLLGRRRHLGLHSGVLGDAAVDLIESGAVTNAHKDDDRGVSVTGALVGTRRLLDFAHHNPYLRVEPVTYTHDPVVLRALPRFTAVNSALEVDLTGQVSAEVGGSSFVGTVGGQIDFARGAFASAGGRSIIALPARVTGSGRPRIVASIASGVVTASRADTDVVVTEFGVAPLRGQSIAERVRRMIAIAHPDDRVPLIEAARHVVGYR